MHRLYKKDWLQLIPSVFPPIEAQQALAVLLDVPRDSQEDNPDWQARRRLAVDWTKALKRLAAELHLAEVQLVCYPSVGSNNADLPPNGFYVNPDSPNLTKTADLDRQGVLVPFSSVFSRFNLFLAPTEYSTTAPLKIAARTYHFRAATMPGFCLAMIPALRIDYGLVNSRVMALKTRLDRADHAAVGFCIDGRENCQMIFDLRNRTAHASGGRFPERGTAGNLPSGEAYIVPYEGEAKECSATQGILPVQFENEIVYYQIDKNRARSVNGEGAMAQQEREHLRNEPAYGNMAELGFGVLSEFGIEPIGEILLDEKLGFHVAFGRSDHFGGFVGAAQFSSAKAVVHIDRIYIPAIQPRIELKSVELHYPDGKLERIMQSSDYTLGG